MKWIFKLNRVCYILLPMAGVPKYPLSGMRHYSKADTSLLFKIEAVYDQGIQSIKSHHLEKPTLII